MANLNASTWISNPQENIRTAMKCVSGHIASIVDTRVIKVCDIIKDGSEFKGYIVSINKEIHPTA